MSATIVAAVTALMLTAVWLYFAGLRGSTLYGVNIENGAALEQRYLEQEYGRLRIVAQGPDGFLYISTSNRDGRGVPSQTDDRIIRLDPSSLPR